MTPLSEVLLIFGTSLGIIGGFAYLMFGAMFSSNLSSYVRAKSGVALVVAWFVVLLFWPVFVFIVKDGD